MIAPHFGRHRGIVAPILLLFLTLVLTPGVKAQDSRYVVVGVGRTQSILGSREERNAAMSGVEWLHVFRRYQAREIKLERSLMAYGLAHGRPDQTGGTTLGAGFIVGLRVSGSAHGLFGQIGFGIQVIDRTSSDLDAEVNTTPTLFLGYRPRNHDWQAGVMWLHASNGGREQPNRGQNLLMLMFGKRF